MQSATATPHPPTVVNTATRSPRGIGSEANNAAASNASSIDRQADTPTCSQVPRNAAELPAREPV